MTKPTPKPKPSPQKKVKSKAKPKAKAKKKLRAKTEESPMAAPDRNKFWTMRSSHGRKPKFENAEVLMNMCEEYFQWVHANPLKEHKQYHHQGALINGVLAKMRPMTVKGLCIFLDISRPTWDSYCERDDDGEEGFLYITTRVREIIDTQKFEGAAADLLNPTIISRDLGLKDATTNEHTGLDGGPLEINYADSARARLRGKLIPKKDSS